MALQCNVPVQSESNFNVGPAKNKTPNENRVNVDKK